MKLPCQTNEEKAEGRSSKYVENYYRVILLTCNLSEHKLTIIRDN